MPRETERLWKFGLRACSLLILLSAWEIAGRRVGALIFPAFSQVLVAWVKLSSSPEFLKAIYLSNEAMVIGFLLAAAAGIPLGLFTGRFPLAGRVANPYLDIFLMTPTVSLVPLFIMIFGVGLVSRIAVVFSFAFIFVAVNAQAGMKATEPSLVEMAHSFGARESQLFTRIYLPSALPAIMAGIRIGISRAVAGMVVAELLMGAVGLGELISFYGGSFKTDYLFATIATIVCEGLILLHLAQRLELRLAPWKVSEGIE
ncbi:MAG TPA: ABC transporter permease [Deltaproteobacteria bacterium]|nr:ABC transporter permease [Deltaproteobacteria bacterium]